MKRATGLRSLDQGKRVQGHIPVWLWVILALLIATAIFGPGKLKERFDPVTAWQARVDQAQEMR